MKTFTVALIGTGIMGFPRAQRVVQAGHRVQAWNRTPHKAQALCGSGAVVVADARGRCATPTRWSAC